MSEREAGGIVRSVEPGSDADGSIQPGDRIVAVDGVELRDVIDWLWLAEEPRLEVTVVRDGRHLIVPVRRSAARPLGVGFAEPVFDGIRQCDNACTFCFIAGLPQGLRASLYVRDDDFRLSFLSGNFVTLTNTDDADIERILVQRLSPLHVSVHAVDPGVRARLVCPTVEDRALEHLERLLAGGIEVHIQVVAVRGVNDGEVLEQTLAYLSALGEGVASVGVVPMGFTAHQSRFTSSFDAASARALLDRVHWWQERERRTRGAGWVYAADELYLLAGVPLPAAEAYDGFPQYENGIGMAAAFLDELGPAIEVRTGRVTLVTGTLFAPVLRGALDAAGLAGVRVLPVDNRLFGGNVSVTGLLGGADIAGAIRADGGEGTYLVPDVVVNSDGLLLDDVPAASLAERTRADVRFIGSDAAALAGTLSREEGRAPQ